MKRFFVAVCVCTGYYGHESVVVGVNASTAKSAAKKARLLAEQVTGRHNFDVVTDIVTDEKVKALSDKQYEHYLFFSGVTKRNCAEVYAESHALYPFWKVACWGNKTRVVYRGACVIDEDC